jgi:hypothetical protein
MGDSPLPARLAIKSSQIFCLSLIRVDPDVHYRLSNHYRSRGPSIFRMVVPFFAVSVAREKAADSRQQRGHAY